MSHNNSMSFDSNNEFMPSAQKNSPPSFDQFMQACFNNPSFFQSMKHFYTSQTQTQKNQKEPNSGNGLGNQIYHQSQPSLVSQNPKNYFKQEERRSQYCEKEIDVGNTKGKEMRKKPAIPLSKLSPSEIIPTEKVSEPLSKPIPPPKVQSFDERPIKTNYTSGQPSINQSVDLNAIKQNKSVNVDNLSKRMNNFDEQPIKGAKEYQMESFYRQPKEEKDKSATYDNIDDRPLTGCSKDFKEMIRQKFPNKILQDEEEEDKQIEEKKPQSRTFLKRGSRQHLSSAVTRSKQPNNGKDTSMNKSFVDQNKQRSMTPRRNQPEIRPTSQNRVLGKRNANQNDRKIQKHTGSRDESFDEEVSTKAKPSMNKEKVLKEEPKRSKPAEKIEIKNSVELEKKKKAKNVFQDNSSQSSSSDNEKAPYFKGGEEQKPSQNYGKLSKISTNDMSEVIQGVYLTKEQLNEILNRYGKIKQVAKQTESEKLATLRKKYNEMIGVLEEERDQNRIALQREREEFERYKAEQLGKIKNERRVMERQVKSTSGSQNIQKEKEQMQQLRGELEKEREDFKRREKNNKIMLQKYKKESEQLRNKLQRLDNEKEKESQLVNKRSVSNIRSQEGNEEKQLSVSRSNAHSVKAKKVEQQGRYEQMSYKDIKKDKKPQQQKETKMKYEYVEEQMPPKNKSVSVKNEGKDNKAENKWVSQRLNSQSGSSQSQDESGENGEQKKAIKGIQWSPAMKLSDLSRMDLSIKMVTDQMIKSLFRHQTNMEYMRYMQSIKLPTRTVVNTTRNAKNDYTAKLYSDRSKQLIYDNGTKKVSFQNGYLIVYFRNGDIKQTLPDKTVLYYFKQKEVDQITLPSGINIYRFENNQVELHFQNGYIEIRHPDGTIKVLGGEHTKR